MSFTDDEGAIVMFSIRVLRGFISHLVVLMPHPALNLLTTSIVTLIYIY